AIAYLKTAIKKAKEFGKQHKEDRKIMVKLQSDRQTERTTLKEQYEKAFSARKQLQEDLTTARLDVRNLMTEKEWDAFVQDSLADLEKKKEKTEKKKLKNQKKIQDTLDKIRAAISDVLKDEQRRKEALLTFSSFEDKMLELVRKTEALNFATNETVQRYAVSREALMEIYDEMNAVPYEAFDSFLNLRDELLTNMNDKKWKKISKALNKAL
ncbi:MAG: hypothetical protein ACR2MM_04825, partial [Flavobacteriaceae bacterium]